MINDILKAKSLSDAGTASNLKQFLEHHLLTEIIPFWERVGPDPDGGFNTCLTEDGTLINRDKFLWSQWRTVWVFARLYNNFGKESRWLELAENIAGFAIKHGWDDTVPGWLSQLAPDGSDLIGYASIYDDGFAMYGLGELFKATGNLEYERWARRTADAVAIRLQQPHDTIPHVPYAIPKGARVHGILMMFALNFQELGDILGEPKYLEQADVLQTEIFEKFYRPEWDLVVERTDEQGGLYPGPDGRAVVPGHVIEDVWFQIQVAKSVGHTERVAPAIQWLRRHLEFGWDEEFGGIILARDVDGGTTEGWGYPDLKLWWPHTEALISCLVAYDESSEPWAWDWYKKVLKYSFEHFYMPETGEWRQRLTRDHKPFTATVALPVKDPFHLPRSLILQIELLRKMEKRFG